MQAAVDCNNQSNSAATPQESILRNRLQVSIVSSSNNNNTNRFPSTLFRASNDGCNNEESVELPLPSPSTPSEYFNAIGLMPPPLSPSPSSSSSTSSRKTTPSFLTSSNNVVENTLLLTLSTSTTHSYSHSTIVAAKQATATTTTTTATSTSNENVCSTRSTQIDGAQLKSSSYSSLSDRYTITPTTTASSVIDSASSTPSTTSTPTSTSKSIRIEDELLQWKDMPKYLQFNPYVVNGYRPLQTFKGCLLSLFYWHNETVNILTHAIPIVYILATVPGLMPWEKGHRFLSFCHVFGSVAPWCGSFVYHLFMNIEKGERVYYRLLKLDMVGIWVSQSFGALPLVTATTFCFSNKWKWVIVLSYCLLCLWGLYKALTASSPWERRLCFGMPFAMRTVLTFMRTLGIVGGNRVALNHVYLQDGVSILGGAIGAMRIPEKWFPGLVDFYLNSHNIMHVLVVVAVYSMHQATVKDFEWMSSAQCDAFNATSETIETQLHANVEL